MATRGTELYTIIHSRHYRLDCALDIFSYAKRYRNGDTSSVRRFLSQNRIRGAILSWNDWDIPEGAKVEYKPRTRKISTYEDNIADILKALYGNWYIDAGVLCLTDEDYNDRVALLREIGYVTDASKPCDGITSTGLALTSEGLVASSQRKNQLLKMYKATLESVSEGVTKAMLENGVA